MQTPASLKKSREPLHELIENGYYLGRINSRVTAILLTCLAKIFISLDGNIIGGKNSIETTFTLSNWRRKGSKSKLYRIVVYCLLKPACMLSRVLIINIIDNSCSAGRVIPQYFKAMTAIATRTRLDAYLNEPTKERIIPWHRDGSVPRDFEIDGHYSFCTVKCFIFLPPPRRHDLLATSGAGSLSMIPGSHKVVRLVDRLYHEGKIIGANTMHSGSLRNWSLEEIQACAEQAISCGYCDHEEIRLINDFLANLERNTDGKIEPKQFTECVGSFFNFVIFDEKCLHMGKGSSTSRRLVMRRFYMAKRDV